MSLNLHQTHQIVKAQMQAPTYDPASAPLNHNRPVGLNEAYRQLKALGWTSKPEMHPDGVPLFRLDSATIRRNKKTVRGWIVEVDGDVYDVEGGTRQMTEFAREKLAEAQPAPAPLSPIAEAAADVEAQHGKLGGRLARAVALAEAGTVEFPHYNTQIDPATGVSTCECPDRAPWVSSGNTLGILTFHNGKGCKHCLAQRLAYVVKFKQEQVAYRKQADRIERRRYAKPDETARQERAYAHALGNHQAGFSNGAARTNDFERRRI